MVLLDPWDCRIGTSVSAHLRLGQHRDCIESGTHGSGCRRVFCLDPAKRLVKGGEHPVCLVLEPGGIVTLPRGGIGGGGGYSAVGVPYNSLWVKVKPTTGSSAVAGYTWRIRVGGYGVLCVLLSLGCTKPRRQNDSGATHVDSGY